MMATARNADDKKPCRSDRGQLVIVDGTGAYLKLTQNHTRSVTFKVTGHLNPHRL